MGDICLPENRGPRIASPLTLTPTNVDPNVILEGVDYGSKVSMMLELGGGQPQQPIIGPQIHCLVNFA